MHSGVGAVGSMHGGSGTRPLGAGYNVVGGPGSEDTAPVRPTKQELEIARRATAMSLKAFAVGYVAPAGTIAGVGLLNERTKK